MKLHLQKSCGLFLFFLHELNRPFLLCSSLITPYVFGFSEFHCHHPSLFMSYSPFVIPLPPMTSIYAAIYNADNPEAHFSFSRLTHALISCTSSPGGPTGTLNSIYTKLTSFSFSQTFHSYIFWSSPSIHLLHVLEPQPLLFLLLHIKSVSLVLWTLPAKCLSDQFFSSPVPSSVSDTLGYVFCCLDFSPY